VTSPAGARAVRANLPLLARASLARLTPRGFSRFHRARTRDLLRAKPLSTPARASRYQQTRGAHAR